MVWRQRTCTCVTIYVYQQTLKPDDDYVLPHQRLWTFDVLVCPAFPVAAARLWNSFSSHVTAAPPPLSLAPSSAVVLNHISSQFLIPLSDSSLICTVTAQWLVTLDTIGLIVFTFNILTFNIVNITSLKHKLKMRLESALKRTQTDLIIIIILIVTDTRSRNLIAILGECRVMKEEDSAVYHDIFKNLPLYNFKCSFSHAYRANSVFIDYYQLFVPFIKLQKKIPSLGE